MIGQQSSAGKGNGDWVGGNGTGAGPWGARDQTEAGNPGSRADLVHEALGEPSSTTNGSDHNNR